jgi:hypothetical protein
VKIKRDISRTLSDRALSLVGSADFSTFALCRQLASSAKRPEFAGFGLNFENRHLGFVNHLSPRLR